MEDLPEAPPPACCPPPKRPPVVILLGPEYEALTIVARKVHELAIQKGWHDDDASEDAFIERTCNNLHDEVSELHEAWRNNKLHSPCDKAEKMKELGLIELTCLQEELADIVIRAFDTAGRLHIDVGQVIATKHFFNISRPMRHGGKRS